MRKGENAGNQHFLLFSLFFLPFLKQISLYGLHFLLSSANACNFYHFTNLSFSKVLNPPLLEHGSSGYENIIEKEQVVHLKHFLIFIMFSQVGVKHVNVYMIV